jgi:cold shock CspA family protein
MRQIRIDYRRPDPAPPRAPQRRRQQTPRCAQHPGVHMVLAGTNHQWNTMRLVCPMCNAMGRPPVEVATGVVSGYWPERGYGFVDNGGPRIFFHVSDLSAGVTPYVGMPVTCRVEQNERGLVGRQVCPR